MIGKALERLGTKMTGQIAPQPVANVVAKAPRGTDPLNNAAITNRNSAIEAYKTQFGTPQAIEAAGGYGNWLQQATGSQAFKDFARSYVAPTATSSSTGSAPGSTSGASGNNTTGGNPAAGQTGGLLSRANNGSSATLSMTSIGAGGVEPVTRTITADELASTQLDKLLSKDSALSQRATTEGMQYANKRGLLNSAMAGEAAYGAWVDRATPIAQQDATRYGQVADKNMDAQNTFKLEDKKFGFDLTLQNDEQSWRAGENVLDRKLTASEGAADRANRTSLQGMSDSAALARQTADQSWRTGEGALDRAAAVTENQAQRDFTAGENDETRAFDRESQIKAAEIAADSQLTQHLYGLEELGYRFNLDQFNVSKTYAAASAGDLYSTISGLLADPNLEPASKTSAINNAITVFNDKMKFGSSVYGTAIPGWGDTTTTTNNTAPAAPRLMVNNAYQKLIGKAPDEGGATYWTNLAQTNNWSQAQLEAAIMATPEYQAFASAKA